MQKKLKKLIISAVCVVILFGVSWISIKIVSSKNFASKPLAAEVKLGNTTKNKSAIYNSGDSVTFTIAIETSPNTPKGATAKIDFIDLGSFGINYSVTPASRTQTVVLAGGGESSTVSFTVTTNVNNSATGKISNQFLLDDVTGVEKVQPTIKDVDITVQRND